jgi:DNA-binding response OmpR family regulator
MPKPVLAQRILVVDDNRDSAESMAMFLQLCGHETRVAHDGRSALDVEHEYQPAIVLLDIGLPGMNGYDVAREIRAARGDSVLLIAMTGWGQEEDRRRARESGFDHHLTKPVNIDVLNNLLSKVH